MRLSGYHFVVLLCSMLCVDYRACGVTYQSAPPVVNHNGSEIQNVQNYSSNPFWNPNGPYNQRIAPQAVYVTGPELNSGDCARAVSAQVASYCQLNNKCAGKRISDIRPAIMLSLSRLPGHNYATACAGYIDSAFDDYMKDAAISLPQNGAVAFPAVAGGAAVTGAGNNGVNVELKNPYAQKTPGWRVEQNARENELNALQAQNGVGTEHLSAAAFPSTVSDLSFSDRVNIAAAGYQSNPAFSGSAYKKIKPTLEESVTPAECRDAGRVVAKLIRDLQTVQKCIANNTPYNECILKLEGVY
ncbi:MAG: hypothetical protein IJ560_00350 [Alphaproteobacteria bacterium]|nr:hypothetical protein [Alphaproteobacteria bacterium]